MDATRGRPGCKSVADVFARNYNPAILAEAQKNYDRRRQDILRREAETAWDRHAKASASDAERKAAKIIWAIREHERDHLFGNVASEAVPGPDTLDMGGQFLTNFDRITTESKLYRIAVRMPKGAHLHLHFNAELAPEILLKEAKKRPNMFIRSTTPFLDEGDYARGEVVFSVLPEDTPTVDLWSPDYNPDFKSPGATPWMKWTDFQEGFKRRKDEDPEEWVKSKMVLSEEDVYDMRQTTNGIWARFNQATRAFKGLVNYETVFAWYVSQMIDNMIEDGVMYAELRPMLLDKFIPTDDGSQNLDHMWQMRTIIEQVALKQKELEAKGMLDKFPFGFRIIYSTPRSIPKHMMQREIQDCIKLHLAFKENNLICGFDLVGAEDRANNIGFYRDELLAMVQTCRDLNIHIPFLFHAGESLLDMGGSKNPENSNLYDAVLFNARRIGHGFSLLKHPTLIAEFRRLDICVELCPTSNELLHLCRNVKEHPFPEILAAGIPCTINSDNPNLFTNSVSHEFYQIMVGSPTMSLHGWRQLAEWSLRYACLSDEERARAYDIHARDWELFCRWVVDEFAGFC